MDKNDTENLIRTYMSQGYTENEARELAGVTVGASALEDKNNGGFGVSSSRTNKTMKTRIKSNTEGRVLQGEEKNAVLREALKEQGYNDSDIALMLGQSNKPVKSAKKPIKSVRIVKDMNFRDFEPWSGAKATYDVIMEEGKDSEMDAMLDEMYPDGLSDTELNDLLWFDADSVYEWLGIENVEDRYDYEDDENSSYPRAKRRENETLFESRKALKSGRDEGGRVLQGEEKNAVLREALKEQGYNDSDIALMLGQSRKHR